MIHIQQQRPAWW